MQVVDGVAVLNHTFTTAGAHSIHRGVQRRPGRRGLDLGFADDPGLRWLLERSLGSLSGILGGLLGNLQFGS
ncbi:hypothetical protein GS498_13250 [Rhodococcus hoagii]|nr:hypothetical protein [Prescottella equi]